jgi:hypothetical protein
MATSLSLYPALGLGQPDVEVAMDCFFCSADGSPSAAIGVCLECGCAACGRHGDVRNARRSVRTYNMLERRSVEIRRFVCAACRALDASQHV